MIDDVRAEGLTPQELKEVITRELSEYVTAPDVTVVVRQMNSRFVSVPTYNAMLGPFHMAKHLVDYLIFHKGVLTMHRTLFAVAIALTLSTGSLAATPAAYKEPLDAQAESRVDAACRPVFSSSLTAMSTRSRPEFFAR